MELGETLTKSQTEFVNCHIIAQYTKFGGFYQISYFENIPSEKRAKHKAWKEAFNEDDFKKGYKPKL